MPYTVVNGVRLYHEEHGAGDPILCIHGTSSSAMVWRQVAVERLARLGRVILYDRRGCTRSERPDPYETSVAQHVEDAAALIRALDAAPAVLIGRSYGGGIAVGVGLRYPLLVRAIVLLEAADLVLDDIAQPWDEAATRAVERAAATEPGRAAEAMFRAVLGDEQWESWPEDFKALVAANSPAVIAEVRGAPLPVSSADLAALHLPVLLVAGEDSLPEFRGINDRLASAFTEARTELVAGGHLIDPGEPAVLRFIGEILGRPPAL